MLSSQAATPDYKAFRGTGSVTVATNPPNGTVTISGSTNRFPEKSASAILIGSNMWVIGSVTTNVFTNTFEANVGGLTNILYEILDGQRIDYWYFASNGVTVGHPQFTSTANYVGNSVVTPDTNCWTHEIVERHGTTTNITILSGGLEIIPGWGFATPTNFGTRQISLTLTNRAASIATNATSVTVDFGDVANLNIYNAWFHLTTNLVVSPTNLVVGRTMEVYFATNSLTYDVVVTNTAANPVKWNFNFPTNGSTGFTKTNSMAARLFLTPETNGTITAEAGYYR